ncbi:MAG: nitroreductase family protein [Burkholderiales bacterium]
MSTSARQPEHPIDPLFTRRWSPRAFTGEAISHPELMQCIEAARWAPSASNSQPWRFIYALRDTPAWTPIFDTLVEFNRDWAHRAGALIVVLSRTRWIAPGYNEQRALPTHSFDAGAAWANLALQATQSGWHAHAMAGFDNERLRAQLRVPEDYVIEAVVAIGKIADKSVLSEALAQRETPSQRLPLKAIVAEGRFAFEA